MTINTDNIITITEVNQNFSKAAKLADKNGCAIIFKNNHPKYMLVDLMQYPHLDLQDNTKKGEQT